MDVGVTLLAFIAAYWGASSVERYALRRGWRVAFHLGLPIANVSIEWAQLALPPPEEPAAEGEAALAIREVATPEGLHARALRDGEVGIWTEGTYVRGASGWFAPVLVSSLVTSSKGSASPLQRRYVRLSGLTFTAAALAVIPQWGAAELLLSQLLPAAIILATYLALTWRAARRHDQLLRLPSGPRTL